MHWLIHERNERKVLKVEQRHYKISEIVSTESKHIREKIYHLKGLIREVEVTVTDLEIQNMIHVDTIEQTLLYDLAGVPDTMRRLQVQQGCHTVLGTLHPRLVNAIVAREGIGMQLHLDLVPPAVPESGTPQEGYQGLTIQKSCPL